MKVTHEMRESGTAIVTLEVANEDFAANVEKALKEYRKAARIPGFRPGHVPMGMLQKMYGNAVKEEEISKIVSSSLYQYLDENKIHIFASPMPYTTNETELNFDEDKELTFRFEVGILPELNIDLKTLNLTQNKIIPTDAEVDNAVIQLTKRFGKYENPDTIGETDLVYGEITECSEEGIAKEEGVKNKTSIEVSSIAQKTIQKKFIGTKVGETIQFPLHKAFKNITDISAMLSISKEEAKEFKSDVLFTVSSVTHIEPHEINEELFEKAFKGEEIKTQDAFKERIKKDLTDAYAREMEPIFMNEAMTTLLEESKVEISKDFLKRWLLNNRQENVTEEQIEKEFDKYHKSAQWDLIEHTIAKKHDISVTQKDVEDYYTDYFLSSYFMPKEEETEEEKKKREESAREIARSVMKEAKEGQDRQIIDTLVEHKLVKLFQQECNIELKEMTLEEFKKENENRATK